MAFILEIMFPDTLGHVSYLRVYLLHRRPRVWSQTRAKQYLK